MMAAAWGMVTTAPPTGATIRPLAAAAAAAEVAVGEGA